MLGSRHASIVHQIGRSRLVSQAMACVVMCVGKSDQVARLMRIAVAGATHCFDTSATARAECELDQADEAGRALQRL